MEKESIHDYTIEGIGGEVISLADYAGKKILIVNVASECGFTGQYAQLQELYQEFIDRLVIIGCPCNDFGGQEPGDHATIKNFCESRYRVRFPLTEKIHIRGEQAHPVYTWLGAQEKSTPVTWNFHKYLLDEKGQLIASFPATVSPFDDSILDILTE